MKLMCYERPFCLEMMLHRSLQSVHVGDRVCRVDVKASGWQRSAGQGGQPLHASEPGQPGPAAACSLGVDQGAVCWAWRRCPLGHHGLWPSSQVTSLSPCENCIRAIEHGTLSHSLQGNAIGHNVVEKMPYHSMMSSQSARPCRVCVWVSLMGKA